MSKRLLVTGAGGFVAGSVITQAGEAWEVHALSGKPAPLQRAGLHWHTVDLLREEELRRAFAAARPDAVIHAAAIADIDYCQANPEAARRVNADLTRSVAAICRECGARMVHLSTDNVFDGERGNYVEADPPAPINTYAETKAEAERAVAESTGNHVVARVALVMGLPMLGAGNSFLPKVLRLLREGREVVAPADEVRTPIDVVTLGRALLELAGNDVQGILHLAGNEAVNRYDLTRRVATAFGCPANRINARRPDAIAGRAPRPRDVSMSNARARAVLRTPMLGLDDAIRLIRATQTRPPELPASDR